VSAGSGVTIVGVAELYRTAAGRLEVRLWCEDRLDRWTTPHVRRVIPTSAGETHLLEAGAGELTVLYLPGTNFNAATSLPLVTALAQHHRVVVADLPGQPGLSDGTRPPGDRLAAYGSWADQVVDEVRGSRLVLVGHSLGAAVALAATPGAADGLLLVDPAGLIRLRVGVSTLRATLAWWARPTPARSARLLDHMHAAGHHASELHVEWMTLVARHTRTAGAPGPLPADCIQRWRKVPRTVLCGAQDCFLPVRPLEQAVRDRLGVELRVLDDAGHLATEDQPGAILAAVADLTGRTAGRA
jgi:pimeloyl-ACP methyl ester carboxylesterase